MADFFRDKSQSVCKPLYRNIIHFFFFSTRASLPPDAVPPAPEAVTVESLLVSPVLALLLRESDESRVMGGGSPLCSNVCGLSVVGLCEEWC